MIADASPAIFRRLMRDVVPPTIAIRPGGAPAAFAMSRTSAAFAAPPLGAARPPAARPGRPPDNCATPSTASRPPFGVRRTETTTPPVAADHGRAPTPVPSDHVGI